MSMMKQYCEEVSVDMGLDGKITDEVMVEAQRRLDAAPCPIEHAVRNWGDEGYDVGDALAGLTTLKQSRDDLLAACKATDVAVQAMKRDAPDASELGNKAWRMIYAAIAKAETQSPETKPPIRRSGTEQYDERSTGNGSAASSEPCDQEPEDRLQEPRNGDPHA